MKISAIIPCFNSAATLGACIDAILAQTAKPYEIIVVDDASTDDSAAIASGKNNVALIRLETNAGAAFARNAGAAQATGDILLFVDSDVALHAGTVEIIEKIFPGESAPDAVVGSYSQRPPHRDFFSVAHNYFTYFNHHVDRGEIGWFWGAIGAVKAEAFKKVGGFDHNKYKNRGASSEDIELGFRLAQAGRKIVIDHTAIGDHLAKFDFKRYLRNDFRKAMLGAELFLEQNKRLQNKHGFANRFNGAAVVAAGMFVFFFALSLVGVVTFYPVLFCLLVFYAFSAPYLAYLSSQEGFLFMLKVAPVHLCAFIAISIGAGVGTLKHFLSRRA